jgi:hypothetical protein
MTKSLRSLLTIDRVKSNQNSPLLRLPPELRYRIWTLVIGVPILRTPLRTTPEDKRVQPLKLPITEGKKAWALLRTCRQIYAETALLPYKSSIFSDTLRTPLKSQLKCLKTFQRAQIEDLQVEVMLPGHTRSPHLSGLRRVKLDILPGLKRIRVLAFRHVNCSETKIEECRTATRSELDLLLAGTNISFMFEVIEMSWIDYDKK